MKYTFIILLLSFLFCSCDMEEGGVRTTNNMEKSAIAYIEENQLLKEGESVSAYYDYTLSLDGTESALITDSRLIYHNKETQTTSINLSDIIDIQHRTESLVGDVIEVTDKNGVIMTIEIAPLNGGETFLNVLKLKVASSGGHSVINTKSND